MLSSCLYVFLLIGMATSHSIVTTNEGTTIDCHFIGQVNGVMVTSVGNNGNYQVVINHRNGSMEVREFTNDPNCKGPEVKIPEFKMPKMPEFKMPKMPEFKMPPMPMAMNYGFGNTGSNFNGNSKRQPVKVDDGFPFTGGIHFERGFPFGNGFRRK